MCIEFGVLVSVETTAILEVLQLGMVFTKVYIRLHKSLGYDQKRYTHGICNNLNDLKLFDGSSGVAH